MKNLLKLLSLILLLAIVWGCNEDILVEPTQYGSITGQVLNKKDGQPISKAAITLSPSGRTVKTDTTGRFRFDTIQVGKYTLKAAKEAYRDEVATAEVAGSYGTVTILYMVNENPPPTEPILVAPTAGATTVATTTVLKWKATDSAHDPLTYDIVVLREGSPTPIQSFSGIKADSLVLKDLDYGTTYTWQVTVSDGVNAVTGKIGSFRTDVFPNVSYVFTRKVTNHFQIFAATSGGRAIQLTTNGSNWRPVVSPNGKQIAFISNMETQHHLFVMNIDGSHQQKATTVPISGYMLMDLSFCWSPDGTELLYPSNDKLYAVRADGSGNGLRMVSQAPAGRYFAGCDWTRTPQEQGDRIAARTTSTGSVYDSQIMVIPVKAGTAGSPATVLTRKNHRVGNPVFSIAGDKLLFTIDTSGYQNELGRQLESRLYLLNLNTPKFTLTGLSGGQSTGSQTLSNLTGFNDLDPRFSPDGAKIIFTNSSNTGTGEPSVWTMDLTGDKSQNRVSLLKDAQMSYWR